MSAINKYKGDLIIIDFGTATTFDFITAKRVYKGGCISPGIAISNEALYQHTSKLPRVEIAKPKRVIGQNTIESIQSGIFYGYVGLIDEIVRRIEKEAKVKTKVIATGGFTSMFTQASRTIQYTEPFLTLDGLNYIFKYLKRRGRSSK